MMDYKKIDKQLAEIFDDSKEKEEKEEVIVREETPKSAPTKTANTVVYDELPSVSVTLPQKPDIELPTYERNEYIPKTNREIEREATNNLAEYKSTAIDSYNKNFEATKNQKEQEKSLYDTKKEQSLDKVDVEFDKDKKEIENNLIKRGMINSSTNALLQEKNEKDKEYASKLIEQEHSNAIAKIDNAIAKAETQRLQAINDFNVAYALKFANRVKELKEQRENEMKKAQEDNNDIAKQEFKDRIEKEKAESELYGESLEHYQTEKAIENKAQYEVANSYNYRIYNILRNQLARMSKEEAYNAVRNDPTYAENLTTTYYLQLVEEFGRGQWVPHGSDYGK
jgi:hypothetical protein